eukprot:ANDGO_01151.mRNA.1 DDT domain-containing protein DDB_G0282237
MPLKDGREWEPLLRPPASEMPEGTSYFEVRFTGEVFLDYEEYVQRILEYQSKRWTCKFTGKSGLRFEEALVSERNYQETVQQFPVFLESALERNVHGSRLNISDLVNALYERVELSVFEGEVSFADLQHDSDLLYPIMIEAELTNPAVLKKMPIVGVAHAMLGEESKKEQERINDSRTFRVRRLDEVEHHDISFRDVQRQKPVVSKTLIRMWLKGVASKNTKTHVWIVKSLAGSVPVDENDQSKNGKEKAKEKQEQGQGQGQGQEQEQGQGPKDGSKKKAAARKAKSEDAETPAAKRRKASSSEVKWKTPLSLKPRDDAFVRGLFPWSLLVDDKTGVPTGLETIPHDMDNKQSPFLYGEVLSLWDFLNRFWKVLRLTPSFSFEDLYQSIEYEGSITPLVYEAIVCMLRIVLEDQEKIRAKMPEHVLEDVRAHWEAAFSTYLLYNDFVDDVDHHNRMVFANNKDGRRTAFSSISLVDARQRLIAYGFAKLPFSDRVALMRFLADETCESSRIRSDVDYRVSQIDVYRKEQRALDAEDTKVLKDPNTVPLQAQRLQKKIEERADFVSKEIEKLEFRGSPLGVDRTGDRYWFFGSNLMSHRDKSGRLFIERHVSRESTEIQYTDVNADRQRLSTFVPPAGFMDESPVKSESGKRKTQSLLDNDDSTDSEIQSGTEQITRPIDMLINSKKLSKSKSRDSLNRSLESLATDGSGEEPPKDVDMDETVRKNLERENKFLMYEVEEREAARKKLEAEEWLWTDDVAVVQQLQEFVDPELHPEKKLKKHLLKTVPVFEKVLKSRGREYEKIISDRLVLEQGTIPAGMSTRQSRKAALLAAKKRSAEFDEFVLTLPGPRYYNKTRQV